MREIEKIRVKKTLLEGSKFIKPGIYTSPDIPPILVGEVRRGSQNVEVLSWKNDQPKPPLDPVASEEVEEEKEEVLEENNPKEEAPKLKGAKKPLKMVIPK